jgi:hypothetical protein
MDLASDGIVKVQLALSLVAPSWRIGILHGKGWNLLVSRVDFLLNVLANAIQFID